METNKSVRNPVIFSLAEKDKAYLTERGFVYFVRLNEWHFYKPDRGYIISYVVTFDGFLRVEVTRGAVGKMLLSHRVSLSGTTIQEAFTRAKMKISSFYESHNTFSQ